jgi:hypothetical protein
MTYTSTADDLAGACTIFTAIYERKGRWHEPITIAVVLIVIKA